MSNVSDGGPAFPVDMLVGMPQGNGTTITRHGKCGGMSLRDWFAGKVLEGLSATSDDRVYGDREDKTLSREQWREKMLTEDAEHCYRMADIMLAVRERAKK